MADEPRAMTQEEIDALFASLSGSVPAVPKADKEADADSPEPAAKDSAEDTNKQKESEQDSKQPAAETTNDDAAPPAKAEADAAAAMGQDDIDALLAEMNGDDQPAAKPEPAAQKQPPSKAEGQADEAEGPLGQDDIDALLAEMNGDDSAPPERTSEQPAAETAAGPLGQDDIDALLAEMNGDDNAPPAQTPAQPAAADQGNDAASMSQDDIDALLGEMDAGDVAPVSESINKQGDTSRVSETGKVNSDLSQEEIDSLVSKHNDSKDDSEALISQDDIDALVRQMSEATSAPDKERITAIMNRREDDIEALLNEAAKNVDAGDAVSDLSSFDRRSAEGERGYAVPVGGMAPEELRGTRFLLAAAVFLLAMCTVAMVFVVSSINRLSTEINASREEQVNPTDDYVEDLRVAQDMLQAEKPEDAAMGVKLLERMRERHPEINREIQITLILARHHYASGNPEKATKEFATVAERHSGLIDDPSFYLEWAMAYDAMGNTSEARRVAGMVIANERYFLDQAEQTLDDEMVAERQQTIRNTYLLLGRLDMQEFDGGDLLSMEARP